MNLNTEIRRYMLENEWAAETSEGVRHAWLKLPRSASTLAEVEAALHELVREGFLECHPLAGGAAIYRRRHGANDGLDKQ